MLLLGVVVPDTHNRTKKKNKWKFIYEKQLIFVGKSCVEARMNYLKKAKGNICVRLMNRIENFNYWLI